MSGGRKGTVLVLSLDARPFDNIEDALELGLGNEGVMSPSPKPSSYAPSCSPDPSKAAPSASSSSTYLSRRFPLLAADLAAFLEAAAEAITLVGISLLSG